MANEDVELIKPPSLSPMATLQHPTLPWRASSSMVMGLTGMLSKGFLYGINTVEVTGLQRFVKILDERQDVGKRAKGLVTVCNHISALDDPLIWGVLPARHLFNPANMRWGLGAHDICFKNQALSTFFGLGQVLPTHRALYSSHGGPFQPTMTQAIRLLSSQPYASPSAPSLENSPLAPGSPLGMLPNDDPFSSSALTYSTTGLDSHLAPSAYSQNRHAWVHVFPEACIHQHEDMSLRYFKWGLGRLILEAEPAPDVLPMFIDGTQRLMPEDRKFPRFVPRVPQNLRIIFGEPLDTEAAFGDLRARWRELVRRDYEDRRHHQRRAETTNPATAVVRTTDAIGELSSNELKYGAEATELRIEVAKRVRDEIQKLRLSHGYPEDDPALGFAETWAREPAQRSYRSNVDGSLVKKE
ncbi:hypothetical protein BX600DRAFT_459726 [Xylariales sp. PMI_506]|nr:hypothetical protein BX600DRAFT_459726 [Xylariales sp. PMI_506]